MDLIIKQALLFTHQLCYEYSAFDVLQYMNPTHHSMYHRDTKVMRPAIPLFFMGFLNYLLPLFAAL